jgi:hypothetical protein
MDDIQEKVQDVVDNLSEDEFIFELLAAYNNPKASISRLRNGDKNKLEENGELEQRSKLFFKVVKDNLYDTIDEIKNNLKGKRRLILLKNI